MESFLAAGWRAFLSDLYAEADEVILLNGCGFEDVPDDTNSFIWKNGYYYGALCE